MSESSASPHATPPPSESNPSVSNLRPAFQTPAPGTRAPHPSPLNAAEFAKTLADSQITMDELASALQKALDAAAMAELLKKLDKIAQDTEYITNCRERYPEVREVVVSATPVIFYGA